MPYPRQIYLGADRESRLIQHIEDILVRYYMDTTEHIDDLLQWQKDYWAKPTNKTTNVPFKNASTLVVPVTAIAVEAVHSRTETTLYGQSQLVIAQAVADDWDIAQKPVEDFVNHQLLDVMDIKKALSSCFLEAEKFGSMIGKVGYLRLVRRGVREIDGEEEEFNVVYRDGPSFDAIGDARFLMPYYATDVQTSEWVGEEHSRTPYEVEQLELGGFFRPGTIIGAEARLLQYKENYYMAEPLSWEDGKKFERNQMDLEKTRFSLGKRIDWHELWMAWDTTDEEEEAGVKKELIIHYHRESKTIMSIRYNYLRDLRRTYRTEVYFPVEHRWRGIGICKMNEQFQRSITVRHRQNIDNATLANMRMFKISKLSGYQNGEPIFPGKMWFLDSMDQLDTVQLGELYPSGYNTEQSDLVYSQQRTGVNEVTLGMPQMGTPGTATSDLARIQEGQKKFDLWYMRARGFLDKVVMDVIDIWQQFAPRDVPYYNTVSNGHMVQEFFQLPDNWIRDGLVIKLKTSSQVHNRILDRQDWQQIAGFFQQYFTGLAQMAQPLGNPQLLQVIFTKGLSSLTEAMRQILETYDVRNIDRLIVKELDQILQSQEFNEDQLMQMMNAMGGMGNGISQLPTGGGTNRINGNGQNQGMDALAQIISAAGAGSSNQNGGSRVR